MEQAGRRSPVLAVATGFERCGRTCIARGLDDHLKSVRRVETLHDSPCEDFR